MVTYRVVAYLIGLAVGYWVLTLAAREKGNLQKTGMILGWIIIIVSFIGPLCLAGSAIICHAGSSCPLQSYSCPWQGGSHCTDSVMGGNGATKGTETEKSQEKSK